MSSLFGYLHPEKASGAEDQHQDQDGKDPGVGERRHEIGIGEHLHEPDEQTAERCPLKVADAAKDRGGESEEPGLGAGTVLTPKSSLEVCDRAVVVLRSAD